MFDRLKPDCVFDVGANAGQYARSLRREGFTGTILSFEPNPAAYDRLAAAAADDPKWHCYPVALGREAGQARFNVMNEDDFSSFLQPLGGPGSEFLSENEISLTVDVQLDRLDALLPKLQQEHGFSNPFLKMDTQGFDLEVFRGAGELGSHFCGLVSEISVRKIYHDAPDMLESLETFRNGGFNVAAFYSVHPRLPLKTIEFNCYMIRNDIAETDTPD